MTPTSPAQPHNPLEVGPVTDSTELQQDLTKEMALDAMKVGRDYCQFMIGASTGGIPIYLGLLALVLSDNYSPSLPAGFILLIPVALFVVSAGIFVAGYVPRELWVKVNPQVVESGANARQILADYRRPKIQYGTAVFLVALISGIVITVLAHIKVLPL